MSKDSSSLSAPKYSKEIEQFKSSVSMKFTGEKVQRPRLSLSKESPAPPYMSSSKTADRDDDDDEDKEILYTSVPLHMKNVDKKYYDLIGKKF